jgi:hypothetical protein
MNELGFAWWSNSDAPRQAMQFPGVHAFERVPGGAGGVLIGEARAVRHALALVDSNSRVGRFRLRTRYPHDAQPDFSRLDFLLVVHVDVVEASRDDNRRWLDEEHAAAQLSVSGTQWYLGYEEIDEPHSFLNLWGLAHPSVIESKEWATARETEWRKRLMPSLKPIDRAVVRPL